MKIATFSYNNILKVTKINLRIKGFVISNRFEFEYNKVILISLLIF